MATAPTAAPIKVTPAHAEALAAAAPAAAAAMNISSFWSWVVPIILPVVQSKEAALWAFVSIAITLPGWTIPDLLAKPAKGGTLLAKDIGWALTHNGNPTKAQVAALLA